MARKIKNWMRVLGISFLISNSFYFVLLFLKTYFAPNFRIIHDINFYGEAHFELILIIIQSIIIITTIPYLIKREAVEIAKA